MIKENPWKIRIKKIEQTEKFPNDTKSIVYMYYRNVLQTWQLAHASFIYFKCAETSAANTSITIRYMHDRQWAKLSYKILSNKNDLQSLHKTHQLKLPLKSQLFQQNYGASVIIKDKWKIVQILTYSFQDKKTK